MWATLVTDQRPRPFAELLRERRRHYRLSQAEAAKLVGASERTWRRWEEGGTVDGRFIDAIREHFNIAIEVETPTDEVARGVAELERVLAEVRASLGRATNVRADLILERNGTTVLVDVKAFGEQTGVETEVCDLLRTAAQDAGWTVSIAP